MDITFASELKLVYKLHYKKIVLHQRFFPDAFQNHCNRLTYSSAFRNRVYRTLYYDSSKPTLHKSLQ